MSIKNGVLDITIGMIKKVIHFNGETPSFYNMMYIQIFHKHIFQVFNKSMYELITKKSWVLSIETYIPCL